MFNKTDTAKSNNTQNGSLPISSAKLSNSTVKQSNKLTNKTANSSPWNKAVTYFHRLSLGTKATVLAIAIGTLPTLGIGAIAYSFANKSIYKQITQAQEAETVGLLDKVNRYILGRYGDVQLLSDLPFLTNPQLRDSISTQQKQSLLDQIVKTYKAYDSIAFFDLQGNVIVQSSGETLENHQDRQYFKDALKQNTAVIGQPEISKTTGAVSVHIAAPVKDATTGQNIGVVRARLPVKMLEETIKNYAYTGHEYHLLDKSGKIFLATQNNQEGRDAKTDFPGLGQRQGKIK